MNRPAGMTERLVAVEARKIAATRAAYARARAERAAAARRRLVLTLALLVTGAVAWAAVVVADFSYVLALVPTVILAVVLVLGRRAAAASARADQRDAARELRLARTSDRRAAPANSAADLRARLTAGSDAADGATRRTSDVAAAGLSMRWDASPESGRQTDAASARSRGRERTAPDTAAGDGWTPVPVPVPTYTLKATAPRRQVEPWEASEATAEAAPADVADAGAPEAPTEALVGADPHPVADTPTSGIDLSAVLARRRAAGQ